MKNFKFNLPAVALMLGISAAFAFRAPSHDDAMRFGKSIDANGNATWVNVTGQSAGSDYSCQNAQEICTAELVNDDPNLGQVIPGTEVSGRFSQ